MLPLGNRKKSVSYHAPIHRGHQLWWHIVPGHDMRLQHYVWLLQHKRLWVHRQFWQQNRRRRGGVPTTSAARLTAKNPSKGCKILEQAGMCSNHTEERLVARHRSTSRAAITVEAENTMVYSPCSHLKSGSAQRVVHVAPPPLSSATCTLMLKRHGCSNNYTPFPTSRIEMILSYQYDIS